jgi:hypothetical protein
MKSELINQPGNWKNLWTPQKIKALHANTNNTKVGMTLLIETNEFKVWSIELAAGKALPFHKHNKPYFYTAIHKGKSRSFYADGSIIETEYEKNDISHFKHLNTKDYFSHNLENIGSTTLLFTTVEFKH